MTTLRITTNINSDPIVMGLSARADKLTIHSAIAESTTKYSLSAGELRSLVKMLTQLKATGKSDEVIKVPHNSGRILLFTGLGSTESVFQPEVLRRAAGAASRALAGHSAATFAISHSTDEELAAIAEGAGLGAYGFHEFRAVTKLEQPTPLKQISIFTPLAENRSAKKVVARAQILISEIALVRDLVNTPASHLNPITFTSIMKKRAQSLGLKVEILNERTLRSQGYGGLTAVGGGSANPPRLLRVSYSPANAKRRIAFVGKGITFDTGGLALKPAASMETMKCDMGGAAAAIAAVFAIARLKLPIAVDAWAALAENMVSSTAVRPSDVITMYGGKTVEVINPDAEGRLVLADALVKAQEVGSKAGGLHALIDIATLTGHQGVALGKSVSAVMANNDQIRAQFIDLARETGEQFWPMPLPEELRPTFDSPIADIANMGERMGGMLVAGLFLREFVKPELPWLHLDIASPAYNSGAPFGYTPTGGTGVSVRTLVRFAESSASHS